MKRMIRGSCVAVAALSMAGCGGDELLATANDSAARADGGVGRPMLFYLDIGGGLVLSQAPDAPQPTTLVSSGTSAPDGIAVDVEGGHLYWTNMGGALDDDGSVQRADLDGGNVVDVVPKGGTFTPKQIRIDQQSGKLYWSDREGMRVQRSNLDGSGLETLVTIATGDPARSDESNHCVGVAVDPGGGWFYWSQKGPDTGHVGSIRRARITMPSGADPANRPDVETLFAGLPEPIDLELDLEAGHLYWTDRGDDTVNRAPIEMPAGTTPSTRTDREILVTGIREAIGLTIDSFRGELYYTGLGGQLGRSRLDGSEATELRTGAGALTGIAFVRLP